MNRYLPESEGKCNEIVVSQCPDLSPKVHQPNHLDAGAVDEQGGEHIRAGIAQVLGQMPGFFHRLMLANIAQHLQQRAFGNGYAWTDRPIVRLDHEQTSCAGRPARQAPFCPRHASLGCALPDTTSIRPGSADRRRANTPHPTDALAILSWRDRRPITGEPRA
jgi:hypothetical protein